jgi:hypothetical protein
MSDWQIRGRSSEAVDDLAPLGLDSILKQAAPGRKQPGRAMSLLQAIRNVISNLREGIDPVSMQPEAGTASAESFRNRRLSIEQTEAFLRTVAPAIPPELRDALDRAVAHAEVPITSLTALLGWVTQVREGQSIAVGRAGWPADHPESRYASELRSLERTLQTLRDRRPEVPPTSNGARPHDSAV